MRVLCAGQDAVHGGAPGVQGWTSLRFRRLACGSARCCHLQLQIPAEYCRRARSKSSEGDPGNVEVETCASRKKMFVDARPLFKNTRDPTFSSAAFSQHQNTETRIYRATIQGLHAGLFRCSRNVLLTE